jgi:hypothetical protein
VILTRWVQLLLLIRVVKGLSDQVQVHLGQLVRDQGQVQLDQRGNLAVISQVLQRRILLVP